MFEGEAAFNLCSMCLVIFFKCHVPRLDMVHNCLTTLTTEGVDSSHYEVIPVERDSVCVKEIPYLIVC